jgi:elongation factor 1-alpha
MSADRAALERLVERGEEEGGPVAFKERLREDVHLPAARSASPAPPFRHCVLPAEGEATFARPFYTSPIPPD